MNINEQQKKLHIGHRKRLRMRFINEGLAAFEPHNALELLLFYGIKRVDTNEIAHTLINRFGSFSAVLDAPFDELLSFGYINENAATLLKLIPELSAYYCKDKTGRLPEIHSYGELEAYLCDFFMPLRYEMCIMLMLDNRGRIIKTEIISQGTPSDVSLHIRDIASLAFRHNASEIILSHNHPSGDPSPSNEDISATKRLCAALDAVGLRLGEHIVVAGNETANIMGSLRALELFNVFSKGKPQ